MVLRAMVFPNGPTNCYLYESEYTIKYFFDIFGEALFIKPRTIICVNHDHKYIQSFYDIFSLKKMVAYQGSLYNLYCQILLNL